MKARELQNGFRMGVLFACSLDTAADGSLVIGNIGIKLGRRALIKESRQRLRKISVSVRSENLVSEAVKMSDFQFEFIGLERSTGRRGFMETGLESHPEVRL